MAETEPREERAAPVEARLGMLVMQDSDGENGIIIGMNEGTCLVQKPGEAPDSSPWRQVWADGEGKQPVRPPDWLDHRFVLAEGWHREAAAGESAAVAESLPADRAAETPAGGLVGYPGAVVYCDSFGEWGTIMAASADMAVVRPLDPAIGVEGEKWGQLHSDREGARAEEGDVVPPPGIGRRFVYAESYVNGRAEAVVA